jgi:uncharacterized DUF497 family protein
MMKLRIEPWDDVKAETNLREHGVSFEEAETVLDNHLSAWFEDGGRGREERMNVIGHSNQGRVLFVVTVELHEDLYRIISARKASPHERKRYQNSR